ncbi:hypothetical protein MRX96_029751 [Rhipicephalus microplus]
MDGCPVSFRRRLQHCEKDGSDGNLEDLALRPRKQTESIDCGAVFEDRQRRSKARLEKERGRKRETWKRSPFPATRGGEELLSDHSLHPLRLSGSADADGGRMEASLLDCL